jgi:hypothetical protein
MSLDVFRGATIAAMILVNDPGDGAVTYRPLEHAQWNGWTPTDLVFPFFIFIVGVAMAFSFTSRMQRGDARGKLFVHVLWRGAVLFAMGLFINGFPDHYHLATLRIYGVLQRIALCYVITSVLALWTGRGTQIGVAVGCVVGYWILMRYISVPGYGVPTHSVPLLDPDRNLAAWLDRKLLLGHLYEGTRDPEGLLSTIPAAFVSQRSDQNVGHGRRRSCTGRRRQDLQHLVSDQQEAVDEFVCAFYRGAGVDLFSIVLLDPRYQAMAQALDSAIHCVWQECDCGLCSGGDWRESAGPDAGFLIGWHADLA